MFGEDDLDAILAESGIDGNVGEASLRGIFRRPDRNLGVLDVEVNSSEPGFQIKISDAVSKGVDIGSAITIGGTDYAVSDFKRQNSGFVRLSLTEV